MVEDTVDKYRSAFVRANMATEFTQTTMAGNPLGVS